MKKNNWTASVKTIMVYNIYIEKLRNPLHGKIK